MEVQQLIIQILILNIVKRKVKCFACNKLSPRKNGKLKHLLGFPSQRIGLQILKSTLKTVRDSKLHKPSYAHFSPKTIKNTNQVELWNSQQNLPKKYKDHTDCIVNFTTESAQVIKPSRLHCEFHNASCTSNKILQNSLWISQLQVCKQVKPFPSFQFTWGSIPNIFKPNKHDQNHRK